jgi:hypothetical protein
LIPGSNLYLQAIRLIKPQPIQYLKFLSRSQNAAKQWVALFSDPVEVIASVQAVARSSYNELGLDFQKNYVKVFAAIDIVDLARDTAGDRFTYNGKMYQIEDQRTWFQMDGWASCTAVEVGPAGVAP